MLINLSSDQEVLECLASDDEFLGVVLRKLMVSTSVVPQNFHP